MTTQDLFRCIGDLSDTMIEEAADIRRKKRWLPIAALAGTSKSTVPRSSRPLSLRRTTAASMTARRIMTKPILRMTGRRGTRTVKNEVYQQPL